MADMKIIVNARALDRAQRKTRGGKLLYRVEAVTGVLNGDALMDTDVLPEPLASEFRDWMNADPNGWRPVPPPVPPAPKETKPDAIERKAPDVPFVDPIAQDLKNSIRQQIEQQQVDARLLEYQIAQGLVDDQYNAALLADWIDKYGQGYRADVNVDRAIRALRPQLHWQELSAFTKRLAALG
jgi:hypothetical protein